MEVGIRKRAWHTCIRYTLLIYDHWGEYTLSKKTRRLVYGVYPNTPLAIWQSASADANNRPIICFSKQQKMFLTAVYIDDNEITNDSVITNQSHIIFNIEFDFISIVIISLHYYECMTHKLKLIHIPFEWMGKCFSVVRRQISGTVRAGPNRILEFLWGLIYLFYIRNWPGRAVTKNYNLVKLQRSVTNLPSYHCDCIIVTTWLLLNEDASWNKQSVIGRLFGADNRPKHYRCTFRYITDISIYRPSSSTNLITLQVTLTLNPIL